MDAVLYEICVEGCIGKEWGDWFENLTITYRVREDGWCCTIFRGVIDQSGLHGVLKHIFGLSLPLISVNQIGPLAAGAPDGAASE